MRLKDLHSNEKESVVAALINEETTFALLKRLVTENGTTLPRLLDELVDAQNRIGRLAVLVADLAAQEVPR